MTDELKGKRNVEDKTVPEDLYGTGVALTPPEEIAGRTPDVHEPESEVFRRDFVISEKFRGDTSQTDAVYAEHQGNIAAVLTELINLGMRADGDVVYDGAVGWGEPFEDTEIYPATKISYHVPVVLARHADGWTMSPRDVVDADEADDEPGDEHDANKAATKRVQAQTKTPSEKD